MQTDEPAGLFSLIAQVTARFRKRGVTSFFRASPSASRRRIDSASSFFSLRFSSSSAFQLARSEISIPPKRDHHLSIADAVLPAGTHRQPTAACCLQHLDDLLFGKSALAHVGLPITDDHLPSVYHLCSFAGQETPAKGSKG